MVPVGAPYQFQQEIQGFREKYAVAEDDLAIKNMTYMEKKALLVQNFGVLKAKRQTASLITNKVNDDGVTNKEGKGTRDSRILLKAQEMEKRDQKNKELADNLNSKKKPYSRESVLPEDILTLIPYKETYEALENEDQEELSRLLSSFARISMQSAYRGFEHIKQKREKKNLMKAHVYLDALITLYRLPNKLQKTLDYLSEHDFKGLNIEALRSILDKFCEV